MIRLDEQPSCGLGDFGCQINTSINDTLNDLAATLASWLGGLIKGALNADSQVTIFSGDSDGTFANQGFANQFGFWLWVMGSVIVIVALVQVATAIIAGDGKKLGRVALSLVAAVPTTYFALLVFDQTNQLMNTVTDALMDRVIDDSSSDGGLAKALMNMTGLGLYVVPDDVSSDPWAVMRAPNMDSAAGLFHNGTLPVIGSILVIGILLIAAGFLAIAMLVRVFGLAVLATIAPLAIMFVGQPKLNAWAIRWVEVVVGLMLAKPLAAAIIGVAVAIGGGTPSADAEDSATITGFFGIIAGLVGLVLAAAAPAMTIGLTRFASAEIQQSVANRPSMSQAAYKGQMAMGASKGLGRAFGRPFGGGGGGGRAARATPGSRSPVGTRNGSPGKGTNGKPGVGTPGAPGSKGSTPIPPTPGRGGRGFNGANGRSGGSFYNRRSSRSRRTPKP